MKLERVSASISRMTRWGKTHLIQNLVIGQTLERMLQWQHIKSKITKEFALGIS